MYNSKFEDCYVIKKDNKLTLGNSTIERTWILNEGMPVTLSIIDKVTGTEWVDDLSSEREKQIFSFSHNALLNEHTGFNIVNIKTEVDDDIGAGKEHFKACILFTKGELEIKWELITYPYMPIIRNRYWIKSKPVELIESSSHNEVQDVIDQITLKSLHCKWKIVSLRAVSDSNNNLVSQEHGLLYPHEHRWNSGNILFVKHTMDKSGMIMIKEAPYALEQINYPGGDFFMQGKNIYVTGTGIGVSDLTEKIFMPAYGSAICLWRGEEKDALKCLKDYHEARHKFNPLNDCFVMSNTWGDRSQDSKIHEDFLVSEFKQAKDIGISHYQIDAGWQERAKNKNGNNNTWLLDEKKFPSGTEALRKAAEINDVKIGLWFTPYLHNNYSYWEEDADGMINMYKALGVTHYKMDGFKIESPEGEVNLVKMMQKVVKETKGAVSFNVDITNWKRLGYLGQTQYGTLFFENRYTDWKTYYPHFVLRNIWNMSKYFPSYRLQAEFLNVERNKFLYEDDPLAPHRCGIEYSFAITMFANPLAWFETTGLSDESKNILRKVILTYRKYQEDILSGLVLPIGEEPDGTSWTGFQSIVSDNEGYLLAIRELNNKSEYSFKLWDNVASSTCSNIKFEKLLGEFENICFDENNVVKIGLNKPFSYALFKYSY